MEVLEQGRLCLDESWIDQCVGAVCVPVVDVVLHLEVVGTHHAAAFVYTRLSVEHGNIINAPCLVMLEYNAFNH